MEKKNGIERLINTAEKEIGYLEKASDKELDSFTANAGSRNYTKYWRDVKPEYQGQPWCAAFVTWVFDRTFGKENTKKLLKHYPYVYCPDLGNRFTKYANPKVGDVVIFWRNGTFAHTGIVTAVSGDRFETIEGASGIIPNGGGVCKKSYYNSRLPGTKFCRPEYSLLEKGEDISGSLSKSPKWTGRVSASSLNVRQWAGVEYPKLKSYPGAFPWKDSGRVRYSKSGGRRRLVLCEDRWKDLRVCVREVHREGLEVFEKAATSTTNNKFLPYSWRMIVSSTRRRNEA